MIADKFVDLYARNSGVRDKLVAERDVVLTYALRALEDAGVSKHLAFKGGTCLRKMVFGSTGRFSEDLDFTLDTERATDDALIELVCKLAGVPVVGAHSMRGLHATLAMDAGITGTVVAASLGHEHVRTTTRSYAKGEAVAGAKQRRALTVLASGVP